MQIDGRPIERASLPPEKLMRAMLLQVAPIRVVPGRRTFQCANRFLIQNLPPGRGSSFQKFICAKNSSWPKRSAYERRSLLLILRCTAFAGDGCRSRSRCDAPRMAPRNDSFLLKVCFLRMRMTDLRGFS